MIRGILETALRLANLGAIALGRDDLTRIYDLLQELRDMRPDTALEPGLSERIRVGWAAIKETLLRPSKPRTVSSEVKADLRKRLERLGVEWVVVAIDDLSDTPEEYRRTLLRAAGGLAWEALRVILEGPDENAKADRMLDLAYILMVSRLNEFRRDREFSGRVAKIVMEATKIYNLHSLSTLLLNAINCVILHLWGEMSVGTLMESISVLAEATEKARAHSAALVLKMFREAIEEAGGLTEEVLRTVGVKLLLVL